MKSWKELLLRPKSDMEFVWLSIYAYSESLQILLIYYRSTLGPRLNIDDFKTINQNPKYLALRQESVLGAAEDPLVILTKSGVDYLKKQWGKSVNKNGKRCPSSNDSRQPIPATRRGDAQRCDNLIFNLILPYYTAPVRYGFTINDVLLLNPKFTLQGWI